MAFLCQIIDGVPVNNYPIDKKTIRIGRSPDNDIHIEDPSISSEHAVIEELEIEGEKEKKYQVRDLESTNSTFVNGEKISCRTLQNDDMVRFGFTIFKFIYQTAEGITETVKIKKSWIPGVYYTSQSK